MKIFHLPDLGEGLPDAEIVEWHVKEGDRVKLDDPLISMETAKAVVDVPSPYTGTVARLYGKAGDVIETGAPLAGFELEAGAAQRAEAEPTGHHHAPARATPSKGAGEPVPDEPSRDDGGATTVIASDEGGEIAEGEAAPAKRSDAGTVVGAMESSDRVVREHASSVGGSKAVPAVRALARKLGVDLARVAPSGEGGVVTMQDVKQAAASGSARLPSPTGRGVGGEGTTLPGARLAPSPAATRHPLPVGEGKAHAVTDRDPRSVAGKPVRTVPHTVEAMGQPEQLRGVRRNMARVMADAHAKVVPTTLCDDADIHAWTPGNDIMVRLIRAIVVASRAMPALNAWFDGEAGTRTLHQRVDVGIAVDTPEGLFVPALRNADVLDSAGIRAALNRIRDQVRDRSIPAEELKGYTISLSNFGVFAGRYATPIVVPPCVAIVAAGKLRHDMVPVPGSFQAHRMVPLSLTFDHRAATGGEAARFLKAMLDDLALPN